jgi:hypothetical protein
MIVHTTTSLRTARHRLEARLEHAEQVLQAMRHGAALHLQYSRSGPRWVLTNGCHVDDEVAKLVVASSSVVGIGDALFAGAASQTWRWWTDETPCSR